MVNPANSQSMADSIYLKKVMSDRVLWLTMCRPDQGNILSLASIATLKDALDAAYADKKAKVIILSAEGRIFCAGHDLYEMSGSRDLQQTRAEQREILTQCKNMMMTIIHGDKPVIACVQGIATASGAQLVSACDLAIAANTATFCMPGVNLGAFCTTPLVGVGRNMHRKHAMEMALTGDIFSAADAVRFGLINRTVSPERLHEETETLAQKIAKRSSEGIRLGKRAFYQQIEMSLEEAYLVGIDNMIEVCSTEDALRGFNSFLTKTSPKWTDEE
ncbi:enoyl-CoA hydratase-related protein [Parasedimentitalea marina]|nr:enoyl-CoA hydratase-related protein [Parasedimentitalea marina]